MGWAVSVAGEESPGPFLGSGQSVQTLSANCLQAGKVGVGGLAGGALSGLTGWQGGAVWEPRN